MDNWISALWALGIAEREEGLYFFSPRDGAAPFEKFTSSMPSHPAETEALQRKGLRAVAFLLRPSQNSARRGILPLPGWCCLPGQTRTRHQGSTEPPRQSPRRIGGLRATWRVRFRWDRPSRHSKQTAKQQGPRPRSLCVTELSSGSLLATEVCNPSRYTWRRVRNLSFTRRRQCPLCGDFLRRRHAHKNSLAEAGRDVFNREEILVSN